MCRFSDARLGQPTAHEGERNIVEWINSFTFSLSYGFIPGSQSPPPPLLICFEWKHHWTALLSVSFHLTCCFSTHAELHKQWPENKSCPPRHSSLCSKVGQQPELLLPWKSRPALKTFEDSQSPTSTAFVRSQGRRLGSWLHPGNNGLHTDANGLPWQGTKRCWMPWCACMQDGMIGGLQPQSQAVTSSWT